MTNCYYLSFLIDEIWLDLQDNIFYFPYHWETFHNRPSGRTDWTFILGWHQKSLNADIGRAEGFDGQASPLGFSEWACVFRWARLFLGPSKWVCEPYFSKPYQLPPSPCVRCTWARAVTLLASGAISTCLFGAGLVRAWSPPLVL